MSDDGQRGDVLDAEVRATVDRIGRADVIVGIPSFNTERTIGAVVTAAEAGLRRSFPDLDAVICISDGGSTDRTLEEAATAGVGDRAETLLVPAETPVPAKVAFAYRGTPGKGSAFRSIYEVAVRLEARACAVVDADLRSITPQWIERLLAPVVHHGYDYVAPVYTRHKNDGTITNSIAYPLTTALYGVRLRQPIGGDFGFSGQLATTFASKRVWDTDVARFGVDIWMTTVAIVEGARIGQAILGSKIHDPKDPGQHLGPMFRQVVGSLFSLAAKYPDRWWDVDGALTLPTFGFDAAVSAEPVEVSVPRLTWRFVEGYARFHDLWERALSPESMAGVDRAVSEAADQTAGLVLDVDLWTRIVYDYLVSWGTQEVGAGPLLDSLLPLYFARTATFVREVRDETNDEAEARVEAGAEAALRLKPYLRERWEGQHVPARRLDEQLVPEDGVTPEGIDEELRAGSI